MHLGVYLLPVAEPAAHRRRFARNFRGVPWVRSPMIHWGCSSARVLTMEYLPGINICIDTDGAHATLRRIPPCMPVITLESSQHEQLCTSHVRQRQLGSSCCAGGLLFYDYGMMCDISLAKRDSLLQLFYATYRSGPPATNHSRSPAV